MVTQRQLAGRDELRSVVVATGCDPDLVADEFVHEAVFGVDAPGPVAVEVVLKRFGLTDARITVTDDVTNKQVDALE